MSDNVLEVLSASVRNGRYYEVVKVERDGKIVVESVIRDWKKING